MILDDLVAATKKRIEKEKLEKSEEEIKAAIVAVDKDAPEAIYQQFLQPGAHVIAEVKKASPSKGLIAKDFDYQAIAKRYEEAEATAISVLTEPDYFLGQLSYLEEIAANNSRPILRKDFVIDPYMIYQAKVAGAGMVLLIVAILDQEKLESYLALAHSLGLAVLVEAHDEDEIERALAAGARMIGVNNRNLKNFTVSFDNAQKLRHLVPENVAFIAESGVSKPEEVQELAKLGVNGVLIGEALMKSTDKKAFIEKTKGGKANDQD
ncbi:indole-3-glycerol phosphate synthase TrpC [Fructobacillus durionis]|uniref:Indole-3-glycerol phosphate synthase n=1 Tax=Fructobacillus durionis TaxID=283737 RepID=A0A1I1FQ18_9LACO|nr:indole-3-glycerol phosphate synthase TrpC [Fructobacillus durionis]SFC01092.1 indole-3-glycerol phosphate synthase [Fructobacillus durionis]